MATTQIDETPPLPERRIWMGVLARAQSEALAALMRLHAPPLRYEFLRAPENGLVMVRGRMGGEGQAFNVGEMTVTRCTVKLENGAAGHSMTSGRRPQHAVNAAIVDALMQDEALCVELQRLIIAPLVEAEAAAKATANRASAATKVEFFTLVRGEDE